MTSNIDNDYGSFFDDNDSFESITINNIKEVEKRPSDIIAEYNKTGPRKSDPYNTDDSTDADTDYNENDIIMVGKRRRSNS